MSIGQFFLKLFDLHKVSLPPIKRMQVRRQIYDAFKNGRFVFVEKDGDIVGFFTWEQKGDSVFINNLLVFDGMRDSANLIYLRKIFRALFPETKKFFWKNRKHDRVVSFN